MRLHRIEESVTAEEVRAAVAKKGECCAEEIAVGPMRMSYQGLCTVIVKCPTEAVGRVAKGGHVMVGWSAGRIEILPPKKLRCFRCLEPGHVSASCVGVDRSNRCFRCGEEGHLARGCTVQQVKCALCVALGRPAGHKMGGGRCHPPQTARSARMRDEPTNQPDTDANASDGNEVGRVTRESEALEEAVEAEEP